MKKIVTFLFITGLSLPASALELALPIDCVPGTSCFVQNYVDRDPGPDTTDFHCGPLSYNGHKGTDIRLTDLPAMQKGVAVKAAAPGTVRGVRDGMADISIHDSTPEAIKNRECGNGVVISHEGGFETQYCHMKKGSITVKAGQKLQTGDRLGEVGLSGQTEFPHLHFELRHGKSVIDPFVGETTETGCHTSLHPLWNTATSALLSYRSSISFHAGFASAAPTQGGVQSGSYSEKILPKNAPALIWWVEIFGILPGDTLHMRLQDPEGRTVAEQKQAFPRSKAQIFQFIGRKNTVGAWPSGNYTATATLLRGSGDKAEKVIDLSRILTVSD